MDAYDHLRTSDKESTEALNNSVETLTNAKPNDQMNAKTEQYVENIEHKVDELYASLEKNTTSGWKSLNGFLTNFQKNIPDYVNQTKDKLEKLSVHETENEEQKSEAKKIEAAKYLNLIKESTNTYLDELDSDLQEVEKLVGGFASKFGSFLKDVIAVEPEPQEASEELDESEANVLFNVPESKVFGSRFEQRQHELNNSKELYLKDLSSEAFDEFSKEFNLVEEKTKNALEQSKDLSALFSKIVPSEISSDDFWVRYFYNKSLLEKEEDTRKKLLSDSRSGQEDEKFDWDDDEEEEDQAQSDTAAKDQSRTSSEVTYSLESANSSTLDVVESKKGSKKLESKNTSNAENDEDEDDWE